MYVPSEIQVEYYKNSGKILDYRDVHPLLKAKWYNYPAVLLISDFQPTRKRWFIKNATVGTITPFVSDFFTELVELGSEKRDVVIYVPHQDLKIVHDQVEILKKDNRLMESENGYGFYLNPIDKDAFISLLSSIFGQSIRYAIFFVKTVKPFELKNVDRLAAADIIVRDIDGEILHVLLEPYNINSFVEALMKVALKYGIEIKQKAY